MAYALLTVDARAVIDEDASVHSDLIGSQSNPISRVHTREHVVDKRSEFGIEGCHRSAGAVEHRIAENSDPARGSVALFHHTQPLS
jgi:hypothetical protein